MSKLLLPLDKHGHPTVIYIKREDVYLECPPSVILKNGGIYEGLWVIYSRKCKCGEPIPEDEEYFTDQTGYCFDCVPGYERLDFNPRATTAYVHGSELKRIREMTKDYDPNSTLDERFHASRGLFFLRWSFNPITAYLRKKMIPKLR